MRWRPVYVSGAAERASGAAPLESAMRHQLAACVVRGRARTLLARARMKRDETLPQWEAKNAAQAYADAFAGLEGVFRQHAGSSARAGARAGYAQGLQSPFGGPLSGQLVCGCTGHSQACR